MPNLQILHVDDSPDDAELVALALRGAAFSTEVQRVEEEAAFREGLARGPDIVLCDYHMPRFSAERALEILREAGSDVPFIVISHHIGESAAVVAMQRGASDYLPKSDLERLPKAIEVAIGRRDAGRERQRAIEALRRSEAVRRGILDSLQSRLALLDATGTIVAVNRSWEEFDTARTSLQMPTPKPGSNYLRALEAALARGHVFARDLARGIQAVAQREKPAFNMEYSMEVGSAPRWYAARVMPLTGSDRGVVVAHGEVTERVIAHLALQDAHQRLQALSARTLLIQEEERRSISAELHDDVGQTLGALKIGLQRLARGCEGEAALVAECLGAADAALGKVRSLSHDLRPPQLEQLGLEEALRWLAERQAGATGIDIRVKSSVAAERRAERSVEAACYRIVQESLNNACRHGNPGCIVVRLEMDERLLKLSVHDNGAGFDEPAARQRLHKTASVGIIGMEERAQLAGGRLKVRSVVGAGTKVSAIFPLAGTSARPLLKEAS